MELREWMQWFIRRNSCEYSFRNLVRNEYSHEFLLLNDDGVLTPNMEDAPACESLANLAAAEQHSSLLQRPLHVMLLRRGIRMGISGTTRISGSHSDSEFYTRTSGRSAHSPGGHRHNTSITTPIATPKTTPMTTPTSTPPCKHTTRRSSRHAIDNDSSVLGVTRNGTDNFKSSDSDAEFQNDRLFSDSRDRGLTDSPGQGWTDFQGQGRPVRAGKKSSVGRQARRRTTKPQPGTSSQERLISEQWIDGPSAEAGIRGSDSVDHITSFQRLLLEDLYRPADTVSNKNFYFQTGNRQTGNCLTGNLETENRHQTGNRQTGNSETGNCSVGDGSLISSHSALPIRIPKNFRHLDHVFPPRTAMGVRSLQDIASFSRSVSAGVDCGIGKRRRNFSRTPPTTTSSLRCDSGAANDPYIYETAVDDALESCAGDTVYFSDGDDPGEGSAPIFSARTDRIIIRNQSSSRKPPRKNRRINKSGVDLAAKFAPDKFRNHVHRAEIFKDVEDRDGCENGTKTNRRQARLSTDADACKSSSRGFCGDSTESHDVGSNEIGNDCRCDVPERVLNHEWNNYDTAVRSGTGEQELGQSFVIKNAGLVYLHGHATSDFSVASVKKLGISSVGDSIDALSNSSGTAVRRRGSKSSVDASAEKPDSGLHGRRVSIGIADSVASNGEPIVCPDRVPGAGGCPRNFSQDEPFYYRLVDPAQADINSVKRNSKPGRSSLENIEHKKILRKDPGSIRERDSLVGRACTAGVGQEAIVGKAAIRSRICLGRPKLLDDSRCGQQRFTQYDRGDNKISLDFRRSILNHFNTSDVATGIDTGCFVSDDIATATTTTMMRETHYVGSYEREFVDRMDSRLLRTRTRLQRDTPTTGYGSC